MSAGGFLGRWARRKAQAGSAAADPKPVEQAGAPQPELDLERLRSLWAENPAIGLPDGLDLDCGNFDAASAEQAFSDLWTVGRKIERQLAETAASEQAPTPSPPLV